MYKVIKSFKGSPDGHTVIEFNKDEEVDLSPELAKVAVEEKWVRKVEQKKASAPDPAAEKAAAEKAAVEKAAVEKAAAEKAAAEKAAVEKAAAEKAAAEKAAAIADLEAKLAAAADADKPAIQAQLDALKAK